MGELYRLDFLSGKSYIGMTEDTAKRRFRGHRKAAKRGSDLLIYRAWRKHGPPKLTVLATLNGEELRNAEIKAIKKLKTLTPKGYNSAFGGEISPMKNPVTAAKVALKAMGNKRRVGHKHSARTKRILSRLRIGKLLSKETRAKISKSLIGNSRALGMIHSKRAKAKMSEYHKGRPKSKETRANMSIAQTKRWAKERDFR